MTIEQEIVGSRVVSLGRPPRSFPMGRVCTQENCATVLSTYNRKDTCFRHSPIRFPQIRNRVKA